MAVTIHAQPELAYVRLDLIDPPTTNVRTEPVDVESLAASIRVVGLINPLRLRRTAGSDRYELVAGWRRYCAAQLAELAEVPVVIDDNGADTGAEALRIGKQLAENVQRVNLTAAEEMGGVQQLLELGLSDHEVAAHIASEPAQVAALRRILALPREARALLDEGALTLEQAAELASCEDDDVVTEALGLIGQGYTPTSALRSAEDAVARRRVLEAARNKLLKAGVPEIDAPSGYSFPSSSKTRPLGSGYGQLHVTVAQHRKQPCHAAYVNRWARSAREAIVYVCTDVTRHAAEADAGVPAQFLTPPEDAKQARAKRRAQKKAWRESHAPRRAVLVDALATMSAGAAISRVAGAIFCPSDMDQDVALLACELLGESTDDGHTAVCRLDARFRSAEPIEQVRVAVAWLSARAERATAKEHGDWREHENVRAHFELLHSVGGYEVSDGERAHLERAFSIRELQRPALAERPQWESDEPAGDGETDASTCDQLAAGSNRVEPAGVKAGLE